MASGTKLLESQLSEYEHKARAVCIGVNHLALDTERIQQDELLQKVKKLEQELKDSASQKSGLPQRATELRSDIKSNSAALRYLETISRLERSFTVLTENVSETSVQLSSPKALTESVYVKKDLGGNVQSCWNYVSNLSRLTQVHIRNAAEYQQFHHAVNEVEAKLSRRIKMTHPDHARPLEEDITGAHVLANELRDHLNHFIHLWNRTGQLLEESRRVVPVHLRLGGVNNGLSTNTEVPSVVMARALLSLAGPNYELAEGEEVRIVSNTDDPHFWKVQTSSGIVEVPSVCLWISDPDLGAVKRAITAREKCVESWELAVDRMRERLRTYYTRMLSHMAENGDVYYSSKNVMQHFLDDLDLLYPPSDTSAVELKHALNRFQDKLQLVERGRQPRDAFVLREQDIVSMHSPLLRLRDHENQMRSLNVQAQFIGQHMAHYLREIDADRRRMDDELKRMTSLQRDHQTQLEHLISRVRRWSSRYDRGHPKFDSQESGTSSSVRSSTRSDVTWHGEAASRVRRDVMDAITQIGVETENAASQTHQLEMTTEVTEYRAARPLKESICQIGQITSVQLIQTDNLQAPPPPQKRDLFQAITQTGTVQADASLQTDMLETSWVGVEQARTQQALPTQVGDAVCQVGYIQSTSHTQTEPWLGTVVSGAGGQHAVGLQTSAAQPARDAICQIGTVTSSASIQTVDLALKPTRSVSEQFVASSMQPRPVSDVICQIGSLLAVQGTQTPHVETSRFHANTQTGVITTEFEVQADLFLERPRQVSTLAAACQVGVLQQPAEVQVSLLTPRPSVLDAICQIGLLQQSVATQVQLPTGRHFDVATQLGFLTMEQQLQTEMLEEIPMVEVIQQQQQRVFTTTANVETQVGVLSHNQATQFAGPIGKPSTSMACQTDLGPVKDTTIQHLGKFYVDSYNVESQTGVITNNWATQTEDRMIETKLMPVVSAPPPKSYAYVAQTSEQRRPKLYEFALQTPQELKPKPRSKSYDVLTQVGIAKESRSTQVEKSHKDYDVGSQVGIISQSKSTQTTEYSAVAPDTFEVELQTGVVTMSRDTQTRIDYQKRVQVEDANVGTDIRVRGRDATIATEEQLVMEPVIVQQAFRPATPKEEFGQQVEILSTRFDVETQSGVVMQADSTQTTVMAESVAKVSATKYDVEMQSGVVTQPHGTQTEAKFSATIPMDDASVQHTQLKPAENKKFQVTINPLAYDTIIESEQQILVDTVTPVKQIIPEVPKTEAGIQTVTKSRYDVELQSGIITHPHSTQTDMRLKPAIPMSDVSMQYGKTPHVGYDRLLETEPQLHVDVVAPIQQVREVIQTDDFCAQASLAPSRYDVEIQSGTVTDVHGTQTEMKLQPVVPVDDASVQHATPKPKPGENKKFQVNINPAAFDTLLESEPALGVELIVPVQHSIPEVPKSDIGTQVHILPERFEVELQSGIVSTIHAVQTEPQLKPAVPVDDSSVQHVCEKPKAVDDKLLQVQIGSIGYDRKVETEHIDVGDVVTEVAPIKYNVEMQSGVVTDSRSIQTDLRLKLDVAVSDASVQHEERKPIGYDTILETEKPLSLEVIAPVQHLRSEPSTSDFGIQVAILPNKFDVELQSGIVIDVHGTQTEVVPIGEVSVQHETLRQHPGENKKFQVNLAPTPVDAILESEPQLQVDIVTPVQQVHPEIPKHVEIQVGSTPVTYDVELQSGIITEAHSVQTDKMRKSPIHTADAGVQYVPAQPTPGENKKFQVNLSPSAFDTLVEAKQPQQQTVLKNAVGLQAEVAHMTTDVQVQSGVITSVAGVQTDVAHKPRILTEDVSIQFTEKRPIGKENQTSVKPTTRDETTQSEDPLHIDVVAPVQREVIPTENMGVQAAIVPTRYDVEMQSGTLMSVHETQTEPLLKPVTPVDDVSVQYEATRPTARDMIVESEKPLSVEVIAPIQQVIPETPKVDMGIQATIVPTRYNVEMQSGTVMSVHETQTEPLLKPVTPVDDVSVQYEATRPTACDMIVESEKPLSVEVIAPIQQVIPETPKVDMGIQATIVPTRYDVEMQSGVVTDVHGIQTDKVLKPVVPVDDASIQYEEDIGPVGKNKKLQVAVHPIPHDRMLDSGEPISVDVIAPVQVAAIPMAEASLQAIITPTTYDVECQLGVKTNSDSTQTDAQEKADTLDVNIQYKYLPEVQTSQKEVQAELKKKFIDIVIGTGPESRQQWKDYQSRTEEEVKVQVLPPVQAVIPSEDVGIQAEYSPITYDVELQSGVLTMIHDTQTDPLTKLLVPTDDASVQFTQAPPKPGSNKKFQVMLTPGGHDTVMSSDLKTQPDVVVPPMYDVELQFGVITAVQQTQTELALKPPVPVDEVNVHYERAMTVSHDTVLESERPFVAEVVAPVQQVIPGIERVEMGIQTALTPTRCDVELQSGTVTTVHGSQTDAFVRPVVPVDDVSVQLEQAVGVAGKNKKFQVDIQAVPYDRSVDSGEPIHVDVIAPVQRMLAQMEDASVQAGITPKLSDVSLQCGTVTNTCGSQTDEIEKPVVSVEKSAVEYRISSPPPGVNKKLQFSAYSEPQDICVGSDIPIQVDVNAPVKQLPESVAKDTFGVQVVISADLYDVETQAGHLTNVGSTQTEAITIPILDEAEVQYQAFTITSGLNKKLQVRVSPIQVEASVQKDASPVGTRSFGAQTAEDSIDSNVSFVRQAAGQDYTTNTEDILTVVALPMEQAVRIEPEKSDVSTQCGIRTETSVTQTSVLSTRTRSVATDEPLSIEVVAPVQTVSHEDKTRKYDVSVQLGVRTQVALTQTEPEFEKQQKVTSTQTEPLTSDAIECAVTTVAYHETVGPSRNKKLQVRTEIPQLDFSTQTEPREPLLSDMQTQTILRDEEMTQTTVSYTDTVRKESQGFRPHPAIPLVESITEFATPHRNKKCQINLVSSEGTKPMTSNKKLQARVIQLDSECQFESRPVVSETTQPVPAVRVEAEAQAGPIQHNKKLQASVVLSTDSVAFVPASKLDASTMTLLQPGLDVWTQIEEPVRIEPEVKVLQLAGQFATPLDRRDCAMQTTLSLTSDAMVDTVPTKYVTQIIQAEAEPTQESSIFRTQLITSFSEKVEAEPTKAEVTHVSFSQRPPQPIELTSKVEHVAYVSKTIQLSVPKADNSLQTDLMTAGKHSPVQTRHVRIQKGSSWLFSRQQDTGIQVDLTEVGQESPLYVRPVQAVARSEVVDTTECYVSSRYGSMTSPTGSARGSVIGGRYMRSNVVNWGVQCTPHTLTGVTQTTDLLKYETGSEISGDAVSIKEDVKQSKGVATIGVQTDIEDEYLIKRVVTTVARRSGIQSYRHNAPVLRQLRGRGRTPLLSSSLPSNLDGQFIEDDDEQLAGVPVTTKKVTTTYLDGTQKVVREELLTEEVQSRARSLDSRIATHMHLSEQDMYEADVFDLPDETDLQADAEHCFNNLLNIWSVPYLLTRIRRRGGSLSVDRDLATSMGTGRPTRLVGAKTQYTSTGSLLLSQTGNTRTAETQTFGFVGTNRPPHKNKRIQRGPSCINWSPSQTNVAVVEPSPPTEESPPIYASGRQTRSTQQQQHEQTQQVGFTTTYTEVHREHSSSFASAVEDYVCPKCGTHAHIPQFGTMSTTQSQSLPITQLRNALSQTRSSGYYTLENAGLTLPVYIGDEELMRINPNQEVVEHPQVSVITWCPGDDIERSDAGSPSTTHDEVWVDSPGKLLEMQVTGVTVPGTNKVISAAEAFYRGILRVVYWDYTKVDPRQTSGDMGVAIPLVDAVLSDAVKLAPESRRDKPSREQTTDDQSTSTLDAHVVWTTPERHRTRYLVHSIRPEVERQEVGSRTVSDAYTVAAAIRAGYIDRDSGLLVARNPPTTGLPSSTMHQYPYGTEQSSPYDEQTETLSVQEAMRRGILQAELIETDSPYQTRSEGQLRTLPLYSPQDMPQDMDI
ncbi:hypothetical protein CRM22_009785 [Opisthorchis felineus]|uniref:Desmoplakin SH3 domain-containing protein n=1 Tax=Opisthorchis felineus TaxID=147828 RepID=A0A4S2L5A5_OPIFE|nr:hypothetical protein CRM22_009785 [Opisthorchis felineus]